MLAFNQLSRSLLGASLRSNFSRMSLRGKKIVYEWQVQENSSNPKPKKWLNTRELEEENEAKMKTKEQEDFRREMLDLNPKTPPPVIEPDDVFGNAIPESKPFDLAMITDIYYRSNYHGKGKLIRLKTAYLREFNNFEEIYDNDVASNLAALESLGAELAKKLNVESTIDISDQEKQIFFNREDVKSILEKLNKALSRTSYKNIPTVILRLTQKTGFSSDDFSEFKLFETMHNVLGKSIHVLTPLELVKIYYGLTSYFPKKGSLIFRRLIRDQIEKINFDLLSLPEIMMYFTAFRTDRNHINIQSKCTKFFISKYQQIEPLLATNDTLALDIVYTFANCRPEKRFWKRIKLVNDTEKENVFEQDKIEHLYMPHVLKNLSKYKEIELVKLFAIFKVMDLRNYDEVYYHFQNLILKDFDRIDPDVMANLIYSSAKINVRGCGTRSFWNEFSKKFAESWLKKPGFSNSNPCLRILFSLVHNKAVTPEEFVKKYGDSFIKVIEDKNTDFNEISLGCWIVMYMDMASKGKDTVKAHSGAVMRALVNKNKIIPLFYYTPVKYFIWYFSKRYPKWRLNLLESLCYHAEKEFSTSRLRRNLLTREYMEFSAVIQKQLDLDIMSLVDFQNLFLIDYAQQDYKFAIFVRGENDCLYSEAGEERVSTGLFDLKREILAQNGWTVCTIDAEEFKGLGEGRIDWLRKQIEASFKKCLDKKGELTAERLAQIQERSDTEAYAHYYNDPEYSDHAYEIQKLEKQKLEEAPQAKKLENKK